MMLLKALRWLEYLLNDISCFFERHADAIDPDFQRLMSELAQERLSLRTFKDVELCPLCGQPSSEHTVYDVLYQCPDKETIDEISKVNIKIGDKEISLTLAEAQELRQILDETFGAKTAFNPAVYSPPVYIRPYVIDHTWRYWQAPYITCSDTGNVANFTLTSGYNSGPDPAPMLVG